MKYHRVIHELTSSERKMPISDDGYSLCPVCGDKAKNREFRPYDEMGYPSYGICGCCGIEYGFDCTVVSVALDWEMYRDKWLKSEIDFRIARKMSKTDKAEQLKQIGIEVRH